MIFLLHDVVEGGVYVEYYEGVRCEWIGVARDPGYTVYTISTDTDTDHIAVCKGMPYGSGVDTGINNAGDNLAGHL